MQTHVPELLMQTTEISSKMRMVKYIVECDSAVKMFAF